MTPPITSPRSDASYSSSGIPDDDYKEASLLQPSHGQDITDKVDSVATKALHVFAGVVIAAMTAFIASHGIIATAAVLSIEYIVSHIVINYAEDTTLDPTSLLSSAEKVRLLAKARLWQKTIKTAVYLGSGAGLMYASHASILQGSNIALLKGIALGLGICGLITGLTGLNGCETFSSLSVSKLLAQVSNQIKLLDSIKTFPSEIQKLLYSIVNNRNSDPIEDTVIKINKFINTHPQYTIKEMSDYLQQLQLPECLDFIHQCLSELIDMHPESDPLELLTEDALTEYLHVIDMENYIKHEHFNDSYLNKMLQSCEARLRRVDGKEMSEQQSTIVNNARNLLQQLREM